MKCHVTTQRCIFQGDSLCVLICFALILTQKLRKENESRLICLLAIIIVTNLATVTTEILIEFLV
jgi:hypothetical protein